MFFCIEADKLSEKIRSWFGIEKSIEKIWKIYLLASRLGEEFEETTTDGRKCKTTVKLFTKPIM